MLRPSLVLIGTAVALLGGGGVLAFAGWTSRSTSATFTITAAKIPQVGRPTVSRTIFPVIAWKGVRISPNTLVHRYVVTRHLGTVERVVCNLPASPLTKCIDVTAPFGGPVTYTVHATHGEHWIGVDSEPSLPLGTVSPTPALDASGVPIAPSADPAAPAASAPVDPATSEAVPTLSAPPAAEVPPATTEVPPPPVESSTSPSPSLVTENLVPLLTP
jgi:hypothetical protein